MAGLIAEVEGLGGTVTSVSGAGLAALFGAPAAHEDDPERAVRAGGRILSVIGAGGHCRLVPGALSVRVGIETGPAVVGLSGRGRLRGGRRGGGCRRRGPVGGQSGFGPGRPGHSCRHGGGFRVGPNRRGGPHPWGQAPCRFLPGAAQGTVPRLPRPSPAGGPRPFSGPPEPSWPCSKTPCEEPHQGQARSFSSWASLAWARPAWCRNAVSVSWPGWAPAPAGCRCGWKAAAASYASSTPYGLYQQLLSAWVGAAPEEGEEVVRPALERAMKAIFGGQVDHVGLLAHMMGLPAAQKGPGWPGSAPRASSERRLPPFAPSWRDWWSRGPTVLVLEDLHWADPISLRLTEELAALAADGPLLLLATRRPEPDPGVSGLESAFAADAACPLRRVELSPLPEEAERALARSLVGAGAGEAVIEAVCAGVEGNPLFLEERLSSLVETGALVKDETTWRLSGSAGTEVPDVLERLVRSRVDRLGPHGPGGHHSLPRSSGRSSA